MLTVDFDRLNVGPGTKVIDVGCGAGRHSFEAYRTGADIIAFDQDAPELQNVATMFEAMAAAGEAPAAASAAAVVGDALALPYDDGTFDVVIASEILEHVPEDDAAIAELVRVLKVGGTLAVTVPRWLPETHLLAAVRRSTTPTKAATSASTRPAICAPRSPPGVCGSPIHISPTACTHRSGG